MPLDQQQFDQTVLEMIEHNPSGAVPRTPAYDDALKRLAATHQVYPNADHRDGWVTARALSRLLSFHPANWEAFAAGTIPSELIEPNAHVFNRYVASLPAPAQVRAETFRVKVAGKPVLHRSRTGTAFHDPIHALFLVPGGGPNRGLPGNYLFGALIQLGPDPRENGWAVDVHDSDDGVVLFDAPNLAAVTEKLQELLASAPFHLEELVGLGFRIK